MSTAAAVQWRIEPALAGWLAYRSRTSSSCRPRPLVAGEGLTFKGLRSLLRLLLASNLRPRMSTQISPNEAVGVATPAAFFVGTDVKVKLALSCARRQVQKTTRCADVNHPLIY